MSYFTEKSIVEYGYTYPMPLIVQALRFTTNTLIRTALVLGCLGLAMLPFGIFFQENIPKANRQTYSEIDLLGRYLIGTIGLGFFLMLVLSAVAGGVYRWRQRTVLNQFALDPSHLADIPIAWQRNSLQNMAAPALGTVAGFLLFIGPITIWASFSQSSSYANFGFGFWLLLTGLVMTGIGIFGISGFRSTTGAAFELWAKQLPPLHPCEPERQYDEDGELKSPEWFTLFMTTQTTKELAAAPPVLRQLVRLENWAERILLACFAGFFLTSYLVYGVVMLRKPCADCKPAELDAAGEAAIEFYLVAAVWILGSCLLILLVSLGLRMVVHLKLRREILALAAQPGSDPPPWILLRQVILEEAPLESATKHLHTLGVLCLAIGLGYLFLGDRPPFGQWRPQISALVTIGAMLLVSYASCWFWERTKTAQVADYLKTRWQ